MILTKDLLSYFETTSGITISGIYSFQLNDEVIEKTRVLIFPSHLERKEVKDICLPYDIHCWKSLKKIVVPKGVRLDSDMLKRHQNYYDIEIEYK